MLTALATADAVTWVSIAIKTFAYAATLSAIGSVLILASLRELSSNGRASLRYTAALSALAAAIVTTLRLPIQASFLMGGTWVGALDPTILGMLVDSPLGTSAIVRVGGLALMLCVLWHGRVGLVLALCGALMAAVSFVLRGHALSEPKMLLGLLITLHILCLGFWLGAFAPLAHAAKLEAPERAGALAHEFGRKAIWAVLTLVLAGGVSLAVLGAGTASALSSAYGQFFAIKLFLFSCIMAVAARNKLAITPALLATMPNAGERLRRSVGVEALLVACVLFVTAALTTISSPLGNP